MGRREEEEGRKVTKGLECKGLKVNRVWLREGSNS